MIEAVGILNHRKPILNCKRIVPRGPGETTALKGIIPDRVAAMAAEVVGVEVGCEAGVAEDKPLHDPNICETSKG